MTVHDEVRNVRNKSKLSLVLCLMFFTLSVLKKMIFRFSEWILQSARLVSNSYYLLIAISS